VDISSPAGPKSLPSRDNEADFRRVIHYPDHAVVRDWKLINQPGSGGFSEAKHIDPGPGDPG